MGGAPTPAAPASSSSSSSAAAAGVASLSLSAPGPSRRTSRSRTPPRLYLAVDCGGTKAAAVVCDGSGRVRGRGFGGPANYTDVGLAAFLRSVDCAVRAALANVADATPSASAAPRSASRSPQDASPYFTPSPVRAPAPAEQLDAARLSPPTGVAPADGSPAPFEAAWFGIAGVDSAADVTALSPHLAALLGLPYPSPRLIVANDTSLLAAPVTDPAHAHIRSGVVVIAGTGSIVMSFGQSDTGLLKTLGRVGGFGWLLGDEGSGYAVGRDAVRLVLDQADRERLLAEPGTSSCSPVRCGEEQVETAEHRLRDRILKHWGLSSTDDLLNAVYSNDTPPSFPAIGASAAPSVASSSPSPATSRRGSVHSDSPSEDDDEEDAAGGHTMIAYDRSTSSARPALHESHATVRGRSSPRTAEAVSAAADATAEPSASLLPPSAPLVDTQALGSPIPSLCPSPSAPTVELPTGESSSAAPQRERRPSLSLPLGAGSSEGAAAVSPGAVATAAAHAVGERKHRLASLAPLVFHLAFAHTDATCLAILRRQARAIAEQVCEVLRPGPSSAAHLRADRSVLCCGGSLVGVARYRAVLEEELARLGVVFARVEYVGDPAMRGAAALAGVWEAKQTAP
jgi:N-acetylglucosamine kinase-like BadF-type ATPase